MKYWFGLVTIIVLLNISCSTGRSAGYQRIVDAISADSSVKLKTQIRAISNDSFTAHQLYAAGVLINYRLLKPAEINSGRLYPLVLILHSSGTPVGTDNTSQLTVLAKCWAQPFIRSGYPAFIVAPQFPSRTSDYTMDSARQVLVSVPHPQLAATGWLIDSLKKTLPVDPARIYVMGFSMGGSSTVNAMQLRPDLFAAGVSISGIPSFNSMEEMARMPLWLIHGNADTENPIASDRLYYKAMKARKNKNLLFWEINGLEHDLYYKLYTTGLIPAWLFRHKKRAAAIHTP
jgi:predicted peptidase